MKTLRFVVGALLILCVMFGSAYAASVSRVVVYGDSLSDKGNLYGLTGYPGSPYWEGRRSNGPVAAEYLADRFEVPLVDYAWIGATTGIGNYADGGTPDAFGWGGLPGMKTAYALSLGDPVDPNALYVVWGGPNDFFGLTDPVDAPMFIARAVTNLMDIVGDLKVRGAKNILVPNMPDLGKTPEGLPDPATSSFLTQVTLSFNAALLQAVQLAGGQYFDTFGLFNDMINNPAKYGFTNVTGRCFDGVSSVCADPDEYLFWDNVHPTTAAHAVLGNGFYRSVAPTVIIGECNSGVPNPLFSTGLTLSDMIAQASYTASNHGQFVSAVAHITNELIKSGVMSGKQKAAIQGCAAKTKNP